MNAGEPDRELEEEEERHDLQGQRDRVDGREENREESIATIPIRRLRRSLICVRKRSRTSARMKIGIWKARPVASIVSVTNEK